MLIDLIVLVFFATWTTVLVRLVFRADSRIRAGQLWRESSYLSGVRAGRGLRNASP